MLPYIIPKYKDFIRRNGWLRGGEGVFSFSFKYCFEIKSGETSNAFVLS